MNPGWSAEAFGGAAALTWGAGDFYGGLAARRSPAAAVVLFAHLISLCLLLGAVLVTGAAPPPLPAWLWGGAAGVAAAFGLMLLYTALAGGRMSVAAPVSALVAAAVPVVAAVFIEGWPPLHVSAGFILALASIWLVSGTSAQFHLAALRLPVLAGLAFGFFFMAVHQASRDALLFPLVAVRITSITSMLVYTLLSRQPMLPRRGSWGAIVLSGVLDTLGNGAYALASQLGRVDVAAVLGSLYPGATVLLAVALLRERLGRVQMLGIVAALVALVLITL